MPCVLNEHESDPAVAEARHGFHAFNRHPGTHIHWRDPSAIVGSRLDMVVSTVWKQSEKTPSRRRVKIATRYLYIGDNDEKPLSHPSIHSNLSYPKQEYRRSHVAVTVSASSRKVQASFSISVVSITLVGRIGERLDEGRRSCICMIRSFSFLCNLSPLSHIEM